MKQEKINQLIAEHCPEKFGVHKESGEVFRWLDEEGIHIETCDICNDLNLMAQVEGTIKERNKYLNCLKSVIRFSDVEKSYDLAIWQLATAEAPQRAEAFLRFIGKWEKE